MPTYEYECNECKYRFEVFQSIKDDAIKVCPKCGKEVRKIFNSTGIIFKGSGFYVNDYGKKEQKKQTQTSNPSTEKSTPATTSTATTKSE